MFHSEEATSIIEKAKATQQQLSKQVIYLEGQRDLTQLQMNTLLTESNSLLTEISLLDEVNKFFAHNIEQKVTSVKHQIEDLINKGLEYIYQDNHIKITVDSVFKNNKMQFSISVTDGKVTSSNLEDSFGGGVLATVSFLFKVIVNILSNNDKLMIFDESLTFVSKHYQERLSSFIKQLCKDLDMTIVLISHQPLLHSQADIVYEAYKDNNSTKFRTVEANAI